MKIQNRQNASLKIIAKEVGVSLMTVSRALNGTGYVAEATKERIQGIADKHKYRPNLLIRGMQTGCTMNIGVIFPTDLGFYTKVLEGIHDELLADKYSIQLSLIRQHMGKAAIQQEQKQLHRLLDLRVDGIILRPVNDQASDLYFKEVFERGVPLVTIDRRLEKGHYDFIGSNDFEAGQQAAEFLTSKGHRDILLVATGNAVSTGRDRRDGFVDFASRIKDATLTIINENDFEYHEKDAEAALKQHPEITAAFCINDTFAAHLYRTATRLGKTIPKNLSVLGFGNLEVGSYLDPPLTTFDQHPLELGKTAARQLLKRMESSAKSTRRKKMLVPANLLTRQSVITRNRSEGI